MNKHDTHRLRWQLFSDLCLKFLASLLPVMDTKTENNIHRYESYFP